MRLTIFMIEKPSARTHSYLLATVTSSTLKPMSNILLNTPENIHLQQMYNPYEQG